jgi:hypothetical protein
VKKLIFIFLLLLAGCENDTPSIVAKRHKEFNSGGFVVGALNDGRKVTRYEIANGAQDNHWIYVVDSTGSTTTNFNVSDNNPDAPSNKNKVVVVVDGVEYVPAEKVE